jgi:hypothetical protein
LPRRQRAEQPPPETSVGGGLEDFKEILNLFRSGTISSYIRKFKELMRRVKQQSDPMSKLLTFGLGLVEVFDD